MTYWVHVPPDNPAARDRGNASEAAPLQAVVPGKGCPRFVVEYNDFTFRFASLAELDTCVERLSQKNLPATLRLSQDCLAGPNGHWLSRMPGHVKSWRYREGAVKYLKEARQDFAREVARR